MAKCIFTQDDVSETNWGSREIPVYTSVSCDEYAMMRNVYQSIEGNQLKTTKQGLANCARKSMEVKRDFPHTVPLWTFRHQIDEIRKGVSNPAKGERHLLPLAVEDFLDLPVFHGEKPNILLEKIAERLARDRPFAGINLVQSDKAWTRACDDNEVFELLRFLENKGLIAFHKDVPLKTEYIYRTPVQITVEGWNYLGERQGGVFSNQVFIAMQFTWETEEQKEKVIVAIKSACGDCGYKADLVSQNHTGYITDKIISEIKSARFVIAELTYNNRGVYFEAGLARGLNVPVFHVVHNQHTDGADSAGNKIHFDIKQVRYLGWNDPDVLREELRDWILATVGRY